MQRQLRSTLFALVSLSLAATQGCLFPQPVGKNDGGDASSLPDSSTPDATGGGDCVTPNGRRFRVGDNFPSDDGCNECSCTAVGVIGCTRRACVDGGIPTDSNLLPRVCTSDRDCLSGQMCAGPEGCGVPWRCQTATGCTADFAPFCSCRGVTVNGSSSCPPEPYAHRGPCASSDGGTSTDGGARTFACGTNSCRAGAEYCSETIPGIPGAMRGYSCEAIPSSCGPTPSCACFVSIAGATCSQSSAGDITVTVALP
ncbi:MAG: hypothetical protein JNK05_33005 [Myxococcales bacterium]|nr:hypothetical protein [Myxococcales bacterium]